MGAANWQTIEAAERSYNVLDFVMRMGSVTRMQIVTNVPNVSLTTASKYLGLHIKAGLIQQHKDPRPHAQSRTRPDVWTPVGMAPQFPDAEEPVKVSRADDFHGRPIKKAEQIGVRADPLALPRAFFGGAR